MCPALCPNSSASSHAISIAISSTQPAGCESREHHEGELTSAPGWFHRGHHNCCNLLCLQRLCVSVCILSCQGISTTSAVACSFIFVVLIRLDRSASVLHEAHDHWLHMAVYRRRLRCRLARRSLPAAAYDSSVQRERQPHANVFPRYAQSIEEQGWEEPVSKDH